MNGSGPGPQFFILHSSLIGNKLMTDNLQNRSVVRMLVVCFIASISTSLLGQGLIDALNFGQILKERYPYYELIFTILLSASLALY